MLVKRFCSFSPTTFSVFNDKHQVGICSESHLKLEIIVVVFFEGDGVGLSDGQLVEGEVHMASTYAVAPRIFISESDCNVLSLRIDFRSDGVRAAKERGVGSADLQLCPFNSGDVNRVGIWIVVVAQIICMQNNVIASRVEEVSNFGHLRSFLVASFDGKKSDGEKYYQADQTSLKI